jgi:hypothetical protein
MWNEHALRHAPIINTHVTNFVHISGAAQLAKDTFWGQANATEGLVDVERVLRSLPPPAEGVSRTIVLRIRFTNTFDSYFAAMGNFLRDLHKIYASTPHEVKIEVHWNLKTFDLEYCRKRRLFLGGEGPGLRFVHDGHFVYPGSVLKDAVDEAFKRHESAIEARASKSRRPKKRLASVEEQGGGKRQKHGD